MGILTGAAPLWSPTGPTGPLRRWPVSKRDFLYGIALEGNIKPKGSFPAKWETSIGIDFGGMPGGYGWVFPKGDHLNFGLGGWKSVGPTLRRQLHRLVENYGFNPANLWGNTGAPPADTLQDSEAG